MTIDVTDDPSLVREMALAGLHRRVHRLRVAAADENLADARKKTPAHRRLRAARGASSTTTASR